MRKSWLASEGIELRTILSFPKVGKVLRRAECAAYARHDGLAKAQSAMMIVMMLMMVVMAAMSRKTENGREIVPKIDWMDRTLRISQY